MKRKIYYSGNIGEEKISDLFSNDECIDISILTSDGCNQYIKITMGELIA